MSLLGMFTGAGTERATHHQENDRTDADDEGDSLPVGGGLFGFVRSSFGTLFCLVCLFVAAARECQEADRGYDRKSHGF